MSIFGAIGGLLGGIFGNRAAEKQAAAQRAWEAQVYKNQIQWKVADARKAGLHPLAAMGHSMVSPTATSFGTPDYSSMGQNIGRAVDAVTSNEEKVDDYTKTVQALNVQRLDLENDLIRTQLVNSASALNRQPSSPPTFDGRAAASPVADLKPEKQESYTLFGKTFKQDPRFSAAERIQNVFGEPAEWPYALVKMLAELNAQGLVPARARWMRDSGQYRTGKRSYNYKRERLPFQYR